MVQRDLVVESVGFYGLNGIAHGIFRFLPGRGGDGRKKGKIIQPRRDPACFRLTLLQPRQHVLRASKDGRRKPGKSRNGKAIATIRRSEEHTSELQSLMRISYAVFCLKKKQIENKFNSYHNRQLICILCITITKQKE